MRLMVAITVTGNRNNNKYLLWPKRRENRSKLKTQCTGSQLSEEAVLSYTSEYIASYKSYLEQKELS